MMKRLALLAVMFATIFLAVSTVSALTITNLGGNHPTNAISPAHNISIDLISDEENSQMVTLTMPTLNFANPSDITIRRESDGSVISLGSAFALGAGATERLIVSVDKITLSGTGDQFLTTHNGVLKATSDDDNVEAVQATIEYFQSFCVTGPARDDILEIDRVDISNFGDSEDSDDDQWFPYDDIEIEVRVQNDGDEDESDDDLEDIIVQLGIIDDDGNNIVGEFEFQNADEEEEEIGDLDGDEDDEVVFRFRLEQSDEDFEGSFKVVVKAYEEGNEDGACVDYSNDLADDSGFSEEVDLEREGDEERFLRFTDIIVSPTQATCSEFVTVQADVVNVGDDTVENPVIRLFNSALGIDQTQTLRRDIDEGDQEGPVTFNFDIPRNARDGAYDLILSSTYEVDDDNYVSEESQRVELSVIGCEISDSSDSLIILASLDSQVVAGEELVVDATITNDGSETVSINVDAQEFSSWASFDSASPRTLTLSPGESGTATLVFTVDEDASGQQSFVIRTRDADDGTVLGAREVAVNIEGDAPSGNSFDFDLGDNGLLWVIGIVNVLLIVLIVVVAVRLSRR